MHHHRQVQLTKRRRSLHHQCNPHPVRQTVCHHQWKTWRHRARQMLSKKQRHLAQQPPLKKRKHPVRPLSLRKLKFTAEQRRLQKLNLYQWTPGGLQVQGKPKQHSPLLPEHHRAQRQPSLQHQWIPSGLQVQRRQRKSRSTRSTSRRSACTWPPSPGRAKPIAERSQGIEA